MQTYPNKMVCMSQRCKTRTIFAVAVTRSSLISVEEVTKLKGFNGDERQRENVHAITTMIGTLFAAVVVTRTMSFVL